MKANKIDVSNTTTLKYLQELREMTNIKEEGKNSNKENITPIETGGVFPRSTYKEDKPNVWAFINLILGAAIGICVVFFLVVPTVKSGYINQIKTKEIEYNDELNKHTQTISSLEDDKDELQKQISQLQSELDSFDIIEYDDTIYDQLFEAAQIYFVELTKDNPRAVDLSKVAAVLSKVNINKLERTAAISLYNLMKDSTFVVAAQDLYNEGHDLYSARKFDESLETLLEAYEYDPSNVNIIYFIGRSYHQLGDLDNAKKFYNILIEDFADTSRASEARDKIALID